MCGFDGIPRIYGVSSVDVGSNRLFVTVGFAETQVFSNVDAVRVRELSARAVIGLMASARLGCWAVDSLFAPYESSFKARNNWPAAILQYRY